MEIAAAVNIQGRSSSHWVANRRLFELNVNFGRVGRLAAFQVTLY
jgi:hypothetical protein